MNDIIKPSTLPGFMELLPEDQLVFNHMIDTIRKNYEAMGFLPLDTPVLEKEEVLLAKGGGETEKQIYAFEKGSTRMAMRFDLTVPLARYVVEHMSDLSFPFRRYQIAKVYRGERAQKGRFREFYQCDIDIIGREKLSFYHDGEIPSIIEKTFADLGFSEFTIHINNRKILNGFFGELGIEEPSSILRIIDKLDKIGWDRVKGELIDLGQSTEQIERIVDFIQISGSNGEKLAALENLNIDNEVFWKGIEELREVLETASALGVGENHLKVDLAIARGLDYYTGTVYETTLDGHEEIGSVCSGGRYDNLAGYYTKDHLPGVGISIGLSRLYDQLNRAGLLKYQSQAPAKVILLPMDDVVTEGLSILKKLRDAEIQSIFYGDSGKLGKKFKYADQLQIPYALIIGKKEVEEEVYTLRNMNTGEEKKMSLGEIISKLS